MLNNKKIGSNLIKQKGDESLTFLFLFVSAFWKTLEDDMRFSIQCPRIWFYDFSFRFSSSTAYTLQIFFLNCIHPLGVCWSSNTWLRRCVCVCFPLQFHPLFSTDSSHVSTYHLGLQIWGTWLQNSWWMVCLWRHQEVEGVGGYLRPWHLDQLENKNFDWFPAMVPVPGAVLE